MKIYPAIDLMNGRCVRLEKGDFSKLTKYSTDPCIVAKDYEAQGATYLHVVDLDGAKSGQVSQQGKIKEIIECCQLKVQVGGGVRSAKDVETLIALGVDRVIIGSLAVKDIDSTTKIFKSFGADQLTLAFDLFVGAKGKIAIATHGWQDRSPLPFYQVLEKYIELGLNQVVCTDISRDGMLTGPNIDLYTELSLKYPSVTFLASGGVSCIEDISKLVSSPTKGVIIGKALYENRFQLSEVFCC